MVRKEKKYRQLAKLHMNLVARYLPIMVLTISCETKIKVLALKIEAMN